MGFKNSIGGWLTEMTDVVKIDYNRFGIKTKTEEDK